MKKIYLLAIAMIGFAASSYAQSATATASATILTPISLTKVTNMNFGNVQVQALTAGTIVLDPDGTRTANGGATLPATPGTVSAATFTVNGEGTNTYAITLPSAAITLSNGTQTMSVDTFTSTPTTTGALVGGTQTLQVGATLNVAAGQATGLYVSPTFQVTVAYN